MEPRSELSPLMLPWLDEKKRTSWKDVELHTDRPTVDLAKLYTTENSLGGNRTSTVRRLLSLGADPHLVLCRMRTADHGNILQAVDAKPGERLTEAFWKSPDTDNTLFGFCVPLLMAACNSNIKTIQLFSQSGARMNIVIERVRACGHSTELLPNPFEYWHGLDHLKAVLRLIEPGQPLIHTWLSTGVAHALNRGTPDDLESVKLLLTAGAKPSVTRSPRTIAPKLMNLAILQSIVPATLSDEQPSLIIAVAEDDVYACESALQHDPNTEVRGAFAMTSLIISAGAPSVSICQLLLNRGANPNACDVFGMSPLMEAIYHGHKEAILSLLNGGADVHYRIEGEPLMDFVGGTPTTYFQQKRWLVQRNATARMCKTNGWNASHLAAHRGFTEIMSVLAGHGAVFDVKDNCGLTPLDLALKNGHGVTADYIISVQNPAAAGSDSREIQRHVEDPTIRGSNQFHGIVSLETHLSEASHRNREICDICRQGLGSGTFGSVNACTTPCRCCKMMKSCNDGAVPARTEFHKDSNMTYLRSLKIGYGFEEMWRHQVRKLPQPWHSLLGQINSLEDANTGSPAAMSMALGWHANCARDHTSCKPGTHTGYFPTRVLDVGSTGIKGRLRLVNDRSMRAPYVALSHRWGTNDLPTTVGRNLATRLEGFDMIDLSQTMRDAIHIVQSLHYKYIWIDALCIVQDSEDDWLTEASQMSNVFSNAAVTIAVADSVEHTQGIFRARQKTFIRPFRIPYLEQRPYRERADFDGDGEYYLFPDTQEVRTRGPLDTRGWILQEQLLSPSILYFDRGEIYWDCITTTASESSPISASLLSEEDPDEVWALKYIRRVIAGSKDDDTRRNQIANAWLEIIKNYSNRDLTKTSDRLMALQGIIGPLERILHEVLVAGMWQTQLWRQLTWWTGKPSEINQGDYEAPSWSWLSVPKRVYYHNSLLGEHPEQNTVEHKYTDLQSLSFKVQPVQVTYEPGLTRITGSITINAKTFSYHLTQMDLKKIVYRRWHAAKLKLNTGRWMLDRPINVPVDIQCLIVAEDAVAKSLILLCIAPDAEQDGVWRRIGLCHWDGLAWQIPSFIGTTPETGTFTLV